jgi:membrane fusion protein
MPVGYLGPAFLGHHFCYSGITSMRPNLFRSQALQAASTYRLGNPIALAPWSWWALTVFFSTFAVCVVAFLATATFPRKEPAVGVLRYSKGEIRVTASRGGIVTALYVQDGQTVEAGDLLAFVTTEQHLHGGDVYDARVLAALERERKLLSQRLAALNASEPLQEKALTLRIGGVARQLVDMQAERQAREDQAVLARQSAAAADRLAAQGWISLEQQRERHQKALAAEQAVAEVSAQITSLQSQKVELELQLTRLPSDIAQTRASIMSEIEALEEKRAAADAQNGFALIARAAGTITAMQARLGQPVDTVKPLMTITELSPNFGDGVKDQAAAWA